MLRPGGQERTFDLVPGCADRAHKAPINRERTEMTYGVPAGGPRTGPPAFFSNRSPSLSIGLGAG